MGAARCSRHEASWSSFSPSPTRGASSPAAERLAMTQPALTRAVAKLERRAGGALFRAPADGAFASPRLGTVAVGRARRLARELADTDEHIGEAIAGRGARLRVSAAPLWMRAVVAPAALRFQTECPGVALTLRSAAFAEGVRLLADGAGDLHLGRHRRRAGAARVPSPRAAAAGDRRHRRAPRGTRSTAPGPPPATSCATPGSSATPPRTPAPADPGPRLASILDRLRERTGERPGPVLRAGAAGLVLLAEGPWLSWLPFAFLARLPALGLKPLPLVFGRPPVPHRARRPALRRGPRARSPVRGHRAHHRARTPRVTPTPVPRPLPDTHCADPATKRRGASPWTARPGGG